MQTSINTVRRPKQVKETDMAAVQQISRGPHMGKVFCVGLGLLLPITLLGCGKVPVPTESYHVDALPDPLDKPRVSGTPIQLTAGEKQKVTVTVRYHRSERTAAKLKYQVQFSAPGDLTLTPTGWDVEQDLTTNDAGISYTGGISIEVAAGAAPGEREVTVTVTPAQGAASTSTLKFQVAKKGG
jgi:hypothetical protein